jgi:hypothetical protein
VTERDWPARPAGQAPAWAPVDRPTGQTYPPPGLRGPRPSAVPPSGPPSGPPRLYPAPAHTPVPSGLFPASRPPRPTYREPFPIGAGRVAIGILAGTLWMALFGLLATSARAYAWWTIIAALLAWPVLVILLRFGDRGIAVGAAMSTGIGLAVAGFVVAWRWLGGDWLLW